MYVLLLILVASRWPWLYICLVHKEHILRICDIRDTRKTILNFRSLFLRKASAEFINHILRMVESAPVGMVENTVIRYQRSVLPFMVNRIFRYRVNCTKSFQELFTIDACLSQIEILAIISPARSNKKTEFYQHTRKMTAVK